MAAKKTKAQTAITPETDSAVVLTRAQTWARTWVESKAKTADNARTKTAAKAKERATKAEPETTAPTKTTVAARKPATAVVSTPAPPQSKTKITAKAPTRSARRKRKAVEAAPPGTKRNRIATRQAVPEA